MILETLYQKYPTKHRPDFILFSMIVALIVFGLLMIISSSTVIGFQAYQDDFYFVKKHLVFLVIGSIAFVIAYIIPHMTWRKLALPFWIGSLVFVAATYIPQLGITIGGSTRWLNILGFQFQPSELLKFTLVLLVAEFVSRDDGSMQDIGRISQLYMLIGVSVLLVLKQPDLGTSIVLAGTVMIVLFISHIPWGYLFFVLIAGGIGGWISILRNPYQMMRIQTFLNPWSDPYGRGFHVIQSLIAVGTGGLFGLGIGQSRQKFFYLPQQYTDFIFSIVSEEFGFLLSSVVVLIFLVLTLRALLIIVHTPDLFSKALGVGLISWISLQTLINISVTLNLIPTTGITLPFISFGGSSLLMTLWSFGIILNISRYREPI